MGDRQARHARGHARRHAFVARAFTRKGDPGRPANRGCCPRVRNISGEGGSPIRELIDVVRDAALDKKAEAFVALDVSGRTILADTFAIVTGRSKIQTRAIADAVVEAIEGEGLKVSRVEGYADGTWILIDLGHVIVHVFTPEQRTFYNLERLWSEPAAREAQGGS
ncbi:MAG: ribosome silencing factor [Candidatus Eremiobacteraeota bacterium]|nr:ribosome silencing factor [Candidatus Eremiobacteraeota bacterium]